MQTKIYFLLVALFLVATYFQNAHADEANAQAAKSDSTGKTPEKSKPEAADASTPKEVKSNSRTGRKRSQRKENEYVVDWFDLFPRPNEQSPVPSAPVRNTYVGNDPQCYPVVDIQYPLFADMCGVLPHVRYSLPNSFGHQERWQIAQVLNTLLASSVPSSSSPTCSRSLRLLICPLLFPPCPSQYEIAQVIPCQQFCKAVKTQCTAPSLDLLPCVYFPEKSSLCPVNPPPLSNTQTGFSGLQQPGVQNPSYAFMQPSALQQPGAQNPSYQFMQPSTGQQPAMTITLPQMQGAQTQVPNGQGLPTGANMGAQLPQQVDYSNLLLRSLLGQQSPASQQYAQISYTSDLVNPYIVNLPYFKHHTQK